MWESESERASEIVYPGRTMRHSDDTPPSSLRGRLCEVFFPALLDEQLSAAAGGAGETQKTPLLTRLGDKAQLDEPMFGASSGLAELRVHLAKLRAALTELDATYTMDRTVRGADRDVTEGSIEVRMDSGRVAIPAAVAMSRGRNREVSLRLYFSPPRVGGSPQARKGPAAPPAGELPAAQDIRTLLTSEAFGGETQLGQLFEQGAIMRDESGKEHPRAALLARLAKSPLDARGFADDLRSCALEIAATGGGELVVLTRGESGLFREARWYA